MSKRSGTGKSAKGKKKNKGHAAKGPDESGLQVRESLGREAKNKPLLIDQGSDDEAYVDRGSDKDDEEKDEDAHFEEDDFDLSLKTDKSDLMTDIEPREQDERPLYELMPDPIDENLIHWVSVLKDDRDLELLDEVIAVIIHFIAAQIAVAEYNAEVTRLRSYLSKKK